MAVKPILFNTDMARVILEGSKTQTRRLIKPRYREDEAGFRVSTRVATGERRVEIYDWDESYTRELLPPYMPGDVLYVRETWAEGPFGYLYKANNPEIYEGSKRIEIKWRPSIHMPKKAARIWLRVTDVGVERVQECTLSDILAELGPIELKRDGSNIEPVTRIIRTANELRGIVEKVACVAAWEATWDATIKDTELERYGYAANPWVWVIYFERCERPEVDNE